MKQSWLKVLFGIVLAATLSALAWGANPAQPGSINYIEGQAFLGAQPLASNAVGSAVVSAGQTISTDTGRAEVLLTPGIFLRIDNNSSAALASATLTNVDVRLLKGQATVEVDEIHRQNNVRIDIGDATTTLTKKGLYAFNADQGQIQVLKGEAVVGLGRERVKLSDDHLLNLADPSGKTVKVDKNADAQNDFYQWSSLRSQYLSEANTDAAQSYTTGYWPGTGWYWDPWFDTYTFIPSYGVLYSPFGFGYYSPFFISQSPFLVVGHTFHRFGPRFVPGPFIGGFHGRPPIIGPHGRAPFIPHDGFRADRFHGNPGFRGGVRGGSFRNGGFVGGGVHGGAFGGRGGFHGTGGFGRG